jgi:hypothetical protein
VIGLWLACVLAGPPEPELIEPDETVEPESPRPKKKKRDPNDPNRLEWGVLPAVSYDIDLGFGFGALVTLAKFKPGYAPYRWRLEILGNATVKNTPGVGRTFPFHEDYIKGDFPGLWKGRLRINAQFRFRKFSNQGWYGLGNGSQNTKPWEQFDPITEPEAYRAARKYNQYDRIYPYLEFNNRIIVWDSPKPGPPFAVSSRTIGMVPAHKRRLEVLIGASYLYNVIKPYPNSKLAEDLAVRETDTADGATLRDQMRGVTEHSVLALNVGLLYDTRDHEYVTTHGSFSELSMRISPGVDQKLAFAQLFVGTAFFQPIAGEWLVVASRVAFDWLFGNVPFYELANFGVLVPRDGPGGSWSVRGVPRQRYFGKQKAIANLELRSMFWRFQIKGQRFGLGALAFLDAGRVWTDYETIRLAGMDVDGTPDSLLGLKRGVGGGLRITWGETLVIRADPAWSPTDKNFGFYVDIGQMF